MANIIAVVWDFDKTLITGYMQDPMFKKFNVDGNLLITSGKLRTF